VVEHVVRFVLVNELGTPIYHSPHYFNYYQIVDIVLGLCFDSLNYNI